MSNPIEAAQKILHISLDELGGLLDKSKPTIISYKKKPETITFDVLKKLSDITGCSIDYLTSDGAGLNKGPELKPLYQELNCQISKKLNLAKRMLEEIGDDNDTYIRTIKEKLDFEINNLIDLTYFYMKKPSIVALGQPDSGKSTLGNYLLGEDKKERNYYLERDVDEDKIPEYVLPTNYAPFTSAITYLHGKDEKPDYLEEFQDTVVIGRAKNSEGEPIPYYIYDDIDEKCIIRKGHHREILAEYCTKEGLYYKNDSFWIDSIHVFLDNDFLREIDYIDVPGYGTGEDEDDVSLTQKMYQSDIMFYLSQADAFFKESDLAILSSIINVRGKNNSLDTLFILGTHANAIGNPEKVTEIMDKGIERLINQMTDSMLGNIGISRNDFEAIKMRCFGFDPKSERYAQILNDAIVESVESFIHKKMLSADEQLCEAAHSSREETKAFYKEVLNNLEADSIDTESINIQKRDAKQRIFEIKKRMDEKIRNYQKKSINEFSDRFDTLVKAENIEKLIEKKGVKNRTESLNDFTTYISNEINDIVEDILKKNSEDFANEVNDSIEAYKNIWTNSNINIDIRMNTFNFRNAFAAGLTGVSVYGALALWASFVAGGSNLGAYILIAKIVSVLSTLGISLGGTAAVASSVSAVGGPVTLGVTIAIVAAVAVFGILTGAWIRRASKKIANLFSDKKENYTQKITEYWMETSGALDHCLDSLHSETMKEFDMRVSAIKEGNVKNKKKSLEQLFSNIYEVYDVLENQVIAP